MPVMFIPCPACGRVNPEGAWCTCPSADAGIKAEADERAKLFARLNEFRSGERQ